jgi:hypothetical protein
MSKEGVLGPPVQFILGGMQPARPVFCCAMMGAYFVANRIVISVIFIVSFLYLLLFLKLCLAFA